jgi:hypothetical protein
MATIIKIKRSSGTSQPNLGQGELGYSWGTGTYTDAQLATVTSYGKMYLGTGTESSGIAANIEVVGGKYFTDLLDHGHGTLTENSAIIVDSAKKINEFYVDNLGFDTNTIFSTDTDGDIVLDPNGAGEIQIPDDTYLTFGSSKDTKIRYDETTDDRLEVEGADWNFAAGVAITISDQTASSGTSSGALVVTGGVGIGGDLFVGGSFNVGQVGSPTNLTISGDLTVQGGDVNLTDSATNFNLRDDTAAALDIKEGDNSYIKIDTVDSAEKIYIGNSLSKTSIEILDNSTNVFQVKQDTNVYLDVTTTDSSEKVTLGNSLTTIDTVIKDSQTSAYTIKESSNIYLKIDTGENAELITVGNNISSIYNVVEDNAATAFNIGESTNQYFNISTSNGNEVIDIGNNLSNVNVIVENSTAAAFVVKNSTSSFITVDTTSTSELITFATANIDIDNNLNIDGGNLTTNLTSTPFNLLNQNVETINFGGAATDIQIGSALGTTNINNDLDVDGDVNIDGGDLTVTTTTFNLANATATTVNAFGDAQNLNIGTASTIVDFGNLKIQDTTIYSESGAGTIVIDPYPSAGDSGGEVVVRGNFTVTGTTITVNSTVMTVNDPVFTIGDSISEKNLSSSAATGATLLQLDSVVGLNVGDIVSGDANISNGTTIITINTGTSEIELSQALTGGIAAGVDLTFTQGADDNMDRGIEFKYYNGSLKTGFFGYDESGISEDVINYYFTYIPDATNSGNVFSGTVGSAYFNTTKLEIGIQNGIPFFDAYKRITTTVAAGTNDATTSNQILTVNGSGVPVWTTTIDGGTY